ncbi:hypothetical protein [Halomonas litopenaei]|uniref:hypothetical protein n=1 Tax=Halomonas litopenaei TaxID=2109328 RepID=UPI001A8CE261|nr:hypothetical protein [Halomonas litopenaei]MBN8410732.1 hypothetical protein [Halomonas litopenaei]
MSSTYWQTQYQSARRKVQELETERDALAAHVEKAAQIIAQWGEHEVSDNDAALALAEWCEDMPATSLSRRDARMKAEALEDITSRPIWCTVYAAKATMLEIAGMHRQQAEVGGDE